jgi:hypothetical protein
MDNVRDVFASSLSTKRKEAKEKTTVKRSTVNRTIVNSTIVQGSMAVKGLSEQLKDHQNRYKSIGQQKLAQRDRNIRLLENADIDEHLHEWVIEGLTSVQFAPWVAKCCHILGLEKVNKLAIAARNGTTKDRLFSTLLKGAMQLHAKREYYRNDSPDQVSVRDRLTGDLDG